MRATITFGRLGNVGPSDLDGVTLRYPFTVRTIREGADKDMVSSHSVTVQISGSLQTMWGLGDNIKPLENTPLIGTLFEYARREVESKLKAGNLQQHSRIDLHSGNSPAANPYDPAKIPEPIGFSFEVEWRHRIGF